MELRISSVTPSEIADEAKAALRMRNNLYVPCEIEYNVYQYEVTYTTTRNNYHKYIGYYVGNNCYGLEFEDIGEEQMIWELIKPLRDKPIVLHGMNYFRKIGKVKYSFEYGKRFFDCCTSEDQELISTLRNTHPKNVCLGGVNLLLWGIDYIYKTVRGNLKERRAYAVSSNSEIAAVALKDKIEQFNQKHEYRKLIDAKIPVDDYVLGHVRVA